MTQYLYPDSKIAAAYNNTGGLVAWESLSPIGDKRFFAPVIYGHYNPGLKAYDLNGFPYYRGFPAVLSGEFAAITQAQRWYLMQTYLGNGYAGYVTMKFRLQDSSAYYTVNCIFDLATDDQMAGNKRGAGWQNYTFDLRKIEVLS
jgi:hypothetical protein